MTLNELYAIADENNLEVYHFPLHPVKSMSVPGAIGIDVDSLKNSAEEKEALAHELGHCIKGAFYTGASPYELRSQKEYIADKWSVQNLVPFNKLLQALKKGINEVWELAEHFEVPETVIKKAAKLYESRLLTIGNIEEYECI